MAEPFLDDGDVASGFDQMERGGVAEDVRGDFQVVKAWAFLGGVFTMEFYSSPDSKASDGGSFVVEEEVPGMDAGVFSCLQVGLDELDGFFP